MKTRSRSLLAGVSLSAMAVVVWSCKNERFAGGFVPPKHVAAQPTPTQPPPTQPPKIPTGAVMLGCTTPRAEALLGTSSSSGVPISLDRLCGDEIMTSEQIQVRRQADIVFVLDVTKSMQPNIDTVKENIVEFASRVGSKGWDARFAAVAFRDPPGSTPAADKANCNKRGKPTDCELTSVTEFMDDATLRSRIAAGGDEWTADDLSDFQEGGQYAINKALDLLQSSRRPAAEAIILYVSDAPAFAGSNHWDFTVDQTAARMAGFSNFRFFHSTLDTVDMVKYGGLPSDPRWVGSPAYRVAKVQAEELRLQSGKAGGWMRFPLDKETFLGRFLEQFDTVWNKVALDCFLQEAEVADERGNAVITMENPGGTTFVVGSAPLQFARGLLATGTYTYTERRCCVRRPATTAAATCEKKRTAQAEILIR